MSDNVKVSIKVRPLIKREKDSKLISQWRIRNNTIASIDGNGDPFVFDHIFDETVSTRQLFDTVCRPVILSAINGINGTIFAYGQTSSGKTYTMIGNDREPGVVPLTAREIFEQIKKIKERQFLIRVGFIEIYNEKIHDLLNTANTNLKIVENQCGDVSVNSKECITNCAEQIIQHVDDGNKARKIGETNMNERSSRSHTIFRITIESRVISATNTDGSFDNEAVQIGILNLVDLAGSERADQTGATGSRFKEGVCINKSLLSLSCVIQKLSENSDKQFINYRDSKLTRILQASLGGNAVTSMICNITPAVVDETYYTLSFAMRAKNIRNKPKVNEILTDAAMMKRLEREIKRLENELRSEQNKNSKIKMMELQNAITLRTNQFINSNPAQLALTDNARRRTWCPSTTEIPRLAATQRPTPDLMGEGRTLMGPPPSSAYNGGQYLVTMNGATPQIAIRTVSVDEDLLSNDNGTTIDGGGFSATLALIGNDESQIDYRGLFDNKDLLARRVRSNSPNGLLNPFAEGDEFVPGELISFGKASLSPLSTVERDLHTPKSLRRKRRSSTGDSPPQFNYEQRCRELEQELIELQEFTKLENVVETQHLKQELAARETTLTDLRNDLDDKEQRLEQLEERCTHLEIELKHQLATATKAENERSSAVKERQAAVREAELHRNQLTGIEFEYERFRQRAEAREKELIESLQEARSASGLPANGSDSFKLDQKREEMKRLEMQNYEFTLQLEECNKQIEQLKSSCLDHQRKLDHVRHAVLQYQQTPPVQVEDVAQSLVNSLRKLLLSQDPQGSDTETNGTHHPNGHDDPNQTNAIDGNATMLGEEKTIHELVKIVEQLETNIQMLEQEKCSQQEASDELLNQLKSKLDSKYASIEQLEKELKECKARYTAQTSEYDELSMQLMDQMQDNENLRKEFDLFKQNQTAQEDSEIGTLRESLQKLTTERDELQSLCDSLKATVEKHTSEVDMIVADKEKLALECSEAKARYEEITSKKDELKKEFERLKEQQTTAVCDETEKMKLALDEQRSEKELLALENDRLAKELEQLRKEQQDSTESRQKDLEQLERLQQLNDKLDERVKQLENELTLWQNKYVSLEMEQKEQVKILAEEQEIVVKDYNNLLLKMDGLEASLQERINEGDKKTLSEQASLLEKIKQLKAQEARTEELQQKVTQYEQEITTLTNRESNKCESFESSLKQLRDEMECTRKDLSQLTEERDRIMAKEKSCREELINAQQTIQALEENIREVEKSLEQHKQDCQEAENQRIELERELNDATNELTKIKNVNSDLLQKTCEGCEQKESFVQELEKAKATLEERLSENEREMSNIKSQLDGAEMERVSFNADQKKLEQEIELLKQMVDQLSDEKVQIEKEHSVCGSKQQSFQSQLEEREEEMCKYITDLDTLRTEQLRLVKEHKAVQSELQEKNATLQQELESLQSNVLQLMSENEALLKEQIDGAETQQELLNADSEELAKLRSCRDESERLVAQLERDLATVRAELEMVRTELLEEKQRRDASERTEKEYSQSTKAEMERLRCSIMALEGEKQRLQEAECRLHAEMEAKEKCTTELEALQQEKETLLEELRKENNDLTIAVQELSAKIVNLEEQMDSNEAVQRKTIDTLVREKHEQEDTIAALKRQLTELEDKLKHLETQHAQTHNELREVRASLEESLAARLRLEADIEESSSVRDVLERELQSLKSEVENLDSKLATERYEQECQVSANLRRELSEKQKELESFMATGRPSLGDGRVVQALRRENEDLLKQLNEARQIDGLKGRQLQERVDELERLETEIARLRDEMSTMRHESSFNEKLEQIDHLQKKVQDSEKVREETIHQKRSLERAFDQLRFKHQSLTKEVDELRRTTDKERKSRRQSTHDDRRGLLFNSKEMATMTDATSADCGCSEMNEKIKELRNKLTLKDCQLNTQKLISSANPLKNEITEMRRKLEEQHREKSLIEHELHTVLEELDRERKDRKRHCTQCMRHSRQQNARCDKAVQAYQPNESPCAAVSVSIVSNGRNGLVAVSEAGGSSTSTELKALQQRYDEQLEQYEKLSEKYQTMKQLCRIRNEKISSLSAGLAEKENENTNVHRSIQNECIQLRQQLKEAENRYAQIYHNTYQMKGKQSISKSDVGLQTEGDTARQEADMYRDKYERYKALAIRLTNEKTNKLNGQRTATSGI
ncbi:centromere-associated protein E [Anopheles maculipalpis]|uniref:centromere-associated protein E n=1 Tax=Anopheles maculipalpis TaxID=1496333 RepID=UPI0021599330|nr:centromere-associated protein E [Anopheles maculipalpis]